MKEVAEMPFGLDQAFRDEMEMLDDEELVRLEASVKTHGCLDSLKVWKEENILLDGHHRFDICRRNDIPFQTEHISLPDRDAAEDWIDCWQIGRRNSTPENKRYRIGRRYNRAKRAAHDGGKGKSRSGDQNDPHLPTADAMAAEYGLSAPTVKRAGKFAEVVDGDPELKKALKARIPTKDIFKRRKREAREADISAQRQALLESPPDAPPGTYSAISIDPPWPYGREYDPEGSRVANPYPEMDLEDIAAIELPAEPDCVLFLWTTHQFLPSAFNLMAGWGFQYKATVVWNKQKIGMGKWVRMQCEFCLVGIKGKPTWDNTTHRDIISEARREHSRKPDAFYGFVEEVTVGNRLDYFSREDREGWWSYGNETSKF